MIDGWERLVCQECGFIFYINPKVAAGALIEDAGRVVLVRRGVEPRAGCWALPSGFAEYGETIEETAIRECREETGLEVELDDLLGVYSVKNDFHGHLVLVLYSAHVVGGELAAGDDASEVGLFAPAELPINMAFQAHCQALHDWRKTIEEMNSFEESVR
jgi:ADP-ribose pyrophosphatase YjhB (NUDIX family)